MWKCSASFIQMIQWSLNITNKVKRVNFLFVAQFSCPFGYIFYKNGLEYFNI